ncbi:MAG: hypothetical protein L0207_03640 [Chlamydiae bacterium]|nr:hypothetical protein [Chlamydiota bacterium]
MKKEEKEEMLKKRISELESINDQLLAEMQYLDKLLKQVGFEEGLTTLKLAAQELLEHQKDHDL